MSAIAHNLAALVAHQDTHTSRGSSGRANTQTNRIETSESRRVPLGELLVCVIVCFRFRLNSIVVLPCVRLVVTQLLGGPPLESAAPNGRDRKYRAESPPLDTTE